MYRKQPMNLTNVSEYHALYIDCNQPNLVHTLRISDIIRGEYLLEEKRKKNGLRNYSRDYPHGK